MNNEQRPNANDGKYIEIINNKGVLRAVKEYRDDTGCSLNEAKKYIAGLQGVTNEGGKKGGCMGVIAALLVLSTAATCLFTL